jgi:hydroxymethylpyrimidine pyrophosphatase-like HAD family hydrolase
MKIVVSDIDNSMDFNHNSELIKTITDFIKKGNMFIVATNKTINYVADALALTDADPAYYICNGGACIFDEYFNILYRKDIEQEDVRPILNILKDDDNILEAYVDTTHGFASNTNMLANGIVARPFDYAKAEITLNSIVMKFPSVHGYINDSWINIMDESVTKGSAMKFLIDTYHLNKDDIYVLGSDLNDLDLMENYHGYLTTDAIEDLKQYSDKEPTSLKELLENLMKTDEDEEDAILDL